MVQLGLWISTNSSHGFVARSNFVFLTTQFQVCHGNTATFFIELRDETTIISVDGTTGIVVKCCWVSSRRNIDSHHAMLLILLGAARLRDPLKKKLRDYLVIFSKWRIPPPFGNPLFPKKIIVYFAF